MPDFNPAANSGTRDPNASGGRQVEEGCPKGRSLRGFRASRMAHNERAPYAGQPGCFPKQEATELVFREEQRRQPRLHPLGLENGRCGSVREFKAPSCTANWCYAA